MVKKRKAGLTRCEAGLKNLLGAFLLAKNACSTIDLPQILGRVGVRGAECTSDAAIVCQEHQLRRALLL